MFPNMGATAQPALLKILIVLFTAAVSLVLSNQQNGFSYQPISPGVLCNSQYPAQFPRNVSDIRKLVNFAIKQNITVKVVGNRQSMTDCICTSGIPLSLYHIYHFNYNTSSETVTVGAGLEYEVFLEKLHIHGRAVFGHPLYSGVTVGGAIATGTHGTGIAYPSSLSQQIVSVSFIDGQGKARKVSKGHSDFRAFRVNLGLLGIIYEVEILTVPQYKLYIRHIPVADSILWNGTEILDTAKEMDYFQFWWFPTNKKVILAAGIRIPVHYPGNCATRYIPNISTMGSNALSLATEMFQAARDDLSSFYVQSYSQYSLYKEMPGLEPIFVEDDGETPCLSGPAVGFSHRITGNSCTSCYWNRAGNPLITESTSIAIPLEKLGEALKVIQKLFEKQLTQFPWRGIMFRFLGVGDAYLGLNEGINAWVAIEWLTVPRWDRSQAKMDTSGYQAMAQILVEQFEGRPHWGRNGLLYTNPHVIEKAFPNLSKFIAAMNKYDPHERFMNSFGMRIKYNQNYISVTADYSKNCALNDICRCKTRQDCGNRGPLDYTCGHISGFKKYPVCRPGMMEQMKEVFTQSSIDLLAKSAEHNDKTVIEYLRRYTVLNDFFNDDETQKRINRLNKKKAQKQSNNSTQINISITDQATLLQIVS